MAIPKFDSFFRPFLELLKREGPLHMRDVQARLQAASGLAPEELAQRLPSGHQSVIENKIGWARTYLYKAGLISKVSRATYQLSESGITFLDSSKGAIQLQDLRQIPKLRDWLRASAEVSDVVEDEMGAEPDAPSTSESMIQSERMLRRLIEDDLLERIAIMTPTRFEWLVEQLVVKLGYGASDSEVRAALSSGAGDSGVDGVIKEDRLGLGQIYLQAKRWSGTVGRPVIPSFVGAMHGRAQKGVFITSSDFSRDAKDYAESLHGVRLRLIDGKELASLMVECGLGVNEERIYRTYRIDGDFFEEND